jgi:quercetin dioxygenase-like cupin family protein
MVAPHSTRSSRETAVGRPIPVLVVLAWPALVASPLAAQQGIETRRLLQQGVTYPGPDRAGEITVLRITLPPGARTGRHRHPYPPTAYVLEGRLEVVADGGGTRRYEAGDAFVETRAAHEGFNPGSTPTVLLAVFPAVKGAPLTVPE